MYLELIGEFLSSTLSIITNNRSNRDLKIVNRSKYITESLHQKDKYTQKEIENKINASILNNNLDI